MAQSRIRLLLLTAPLLLLAGCSTTPHYLAGDMPVVRWSEQATQPPLKFSMEWAMPLQRGPHPTVIVHPGLGYNAADLRGITTQLATQGYLAVAVDYQRLINGHYTSTLFPWRDPADSRLALARIMDNPFVDRERLATLGFSLGGAHSLLLAAENPQIKAVIGYYPMSDFPSWIAERQTNLLWRALFTILRWNYNAESPQHSDTKHLRLLQWYSAINHSEQLSAPVLLIHGDADEIAPLRHSQRLKRALQRQGSDSTLLVLPGTGHAFNTRPSAATERSWEATLSWLRRYLPARTNLAMAR